MSVETRVNKSGRPLTPWELPKLLEPMHRWKRHKRGTARWRPHFLPILAFVYRNRFAVASQIQRRFPGSLRSDRTARRHLAELEATGFLGVADTRSTSPLFPKVYFVTGRGVHKVEESLRERGKPGRCCRQDRQRPEAYSPEHVLHEIMTTEFLLNVWETIQRRSDLKLLTVQRRSLERHVAFRIQMLGPRARLKPDAMFLHRQNDGLMCCFLEMDNGTMGASQMKAKFGGYAAWARSASGQEYLLQLYESHGAVQPRPTFRVLLVTRHRLGGNDDRRLEALSKLARGLGPSINSRLWFTTVRDLQRPEEGSLPLDRPVWRHGCSARGLPTARRCLF